MDDPTDLERPRERTPEEERAAAELPDVAAESGARRPGALELDASGRLTRIQHQSARQHRRRLAGRAAIRAAAVAAVALIEPVVLLGGHGGGVVAAPGSERWPEGPAPEESMAPSEDDEPVGEAARAGGSLEPTDDR